ncbi:MAG: hypothetical protein AAB654_06850 [Acidobacteriota bacterium]
MSWQSLYLAPNERLRKLLGLARRLAERLTITGYREYCAGPPAGRALLSYMVSPLLPPPRWRDKVLFSNRGLAQEIPRALNELGYELDILHYENTAWTPKRHYDLFVGHAAYNFCRIAEALGESAVRIYFSTGIYWREWNRREAERFYELAVRSGYFLPADRAIAQSEEEANSRADGIIFLGNREVAHTYARFTNAIGLNNAAYPVLWDGVVKQEYGPGRSHFLFFSGRGNVHKGLDLLLEAFVDTGLHLHICQHLEPAFRRVYKQELEGAPNIHPHGYIPMRSPAFYRLAAQCNWVISATCAEGQPGAVIECMAHGLIPILPNSANIDVESWGVRLPRCDVDTIRTVIREAAGMPERECRRRAREMLAEVPESHSVERFRSSFKRAVETIVAAVRRGSGRTGGAVLGHALCR